VGAHQQKLCKKLRNNSDGLGVVDAYTSKKNLKHPEKCKKNNNLNNTKRQNVN